MFFAKFRNKITTILKPSTSEGVNGEGRTGHVFRLGGPRIQIGNVNIRRIYVCTYKNVRYRSQFELIFTKLTRLMRVHPTANPVAFGNNRLNRTTDIRVNILQNQFFGLKSDGLDFCAKEI